jgi:site-specific DNA recombinase
VRSLATWASQSIAWRELVSQPADSQTQRQCGASRMNTRLKSGNRLFRPYSASASVPAWLVLRKVPAAIPCATRARAAPRLQAALVTGYRQSLFGAFGYPSGNGGLRSLLRASYAFLWRHAGGSFLPARTTPELSALCALLTEEVPYVRRQPLSRHAIILHQVLGKAKILLDLIEGLRYDRDVKAIAYVRVSTDKQADRGVSLEAQAEKVRAMAVVQGAELVDIIVDGGQSAKSLERPGMARLLALVDAGAVDTVIVAKLDRLTRSVKDLSGLLERFQRRGVALVSVAESLDTASAAGRLVLNILTAVSQWEREAIGERTRDAMNHKRANGERVGTVPFGWRLAPDGVHLQENPPEQEIVSMARELYGVGYMLCEVTEELNRQGLRTRRGTPWRYQYVARVLKAA